MEYVFETVTKATEAMTDVVKDAAKAIEIKGKEANQAVADLNEGLSMIKGPFQR